MLNIKYSWVSQTQVDIFHCIEKIGILGTTVFNVKHIRISIVIKKYIINKRYRKFIEFWCKMECYVHMRYDRIFSLVAVPLVKTYFFLDSPNEITLDLSSKSANILNFFDTHTVDLYSLYHHIFIVKLVFLLDSYNEHVLLLWT